jgi:periplasmic protein TonB
MADESGFVRATANDRFKESSGSWFWMGLIGATLFHFLVLAFWPKMTAADVSFTTAELEAIELPPEIQIPPPPEQIARPATPVVSEANIDEDITITPTTFDENPIENLPPPPTSRGDELSGFEAFTPSMVRPELRNRTEVQNAITRNYPPLLKDAGVGGRVVINFWIDEEGRVVRSAIAQSSGHKDLDEAALRVADIMRFSPAMNRDRRVRVVVALPVTFSAR